MRPSDFTLTGRGAAKVVVVGGIAGLATAYELGKAGYDCTVLEAEREKRAVAVGVKIYGAKYRTELASSFSHHWRQTPHLEAAWHGTPAGTPGGPDDARYKPLNEPTGRVYFAGDWLSYTDAWQHGSFTSARKAVAALHARVLSA